MLAPLVSVAVAVNNEEGEEEFGDAAECLVSTFSIISSSSSSSNSGSTAFIPFPISFLLLLLLLLRFSSPID